MHNELLDDIASVEGEDTLLMKLVHSARLDAIRAEQSANPGGLHAFIRYFWKHLEPKEPFVDGWVLHAMCKHLEAVDRGEILRLLINVPPGSMKSLLCSVFFPLWQWGPRDKPDQRYLNFSYSSHLTQRDNDRMLRVLQSPEWIELWGPRHETVIENGRRIKRARGFELRAAGKEQISTSKTGWKLATSVGGVGTGERGNVVLLDDPHSIAEADSDVVRPKTVLWFKEAMSNRLNNYETSTIIVIMQRTHEADVSGEILDSGLPYVHLCIPMEYEADEHCTTFDNDGNVYWTDPRSEEGELMWPERFPRHIVEKDIKPLGDHVWVGQYQQRPEPRGGAIIKREYWRNYEIPTEGKRKGKWPEWIYMVGSLDSAFTEKTENDPSGFSLWGVFQDEEGSHAAMLLQAWRKWLTLGGTRRFPEKLKAQSWADYKQETSQYWGVIQWARYEMARFGGKNLLIENKANGQDIYNECLKHAEHDQWSMTLIDPKNLDKMARLVRIQPTFSEGLVYAVLDNPKHSYVKVAVDEMASAPRGRYRDITDSATQALWWLRDNAFLEHVGVQQKREERARERAGKRTKPKKSLYGT